MIKNKNYTNLIKAIDESYNKINQAINNIISDEEYLEYDEGIFKLLEDFEEGFKALFEDSILVENNYKLTNRENISSYNRNN